MPRIVPRNRALAVVFWIAVALVAVAAVFTAFYFLDEYLPGGGMF